MSAAPWICGLDEPAAGNVALGGGKTLGLHRLLWAGLPVPPGFCLTTAAFEQHVIADAGVRAAIAELATQPVGAPLRDSAARVRQAVLACELPAEFRRQIVRAWVDRTDRAAVAVRSSATAEDLASASFAGQQDTLLSIDSEEALLQALRTCWASLFSDRAVTYRRERGIADRGVSMAVVVQKMVRADAAGVLFTADPLSGHRGILVIEAVRGLGEALVSGHATPQRVRLRATDRQVLQALDERGQPLVSEQAILGPTQVDALGQLGLRAQADAGCPQDLEWAIADGTLWLLQSRPITTLWPLPEGPLPPGFRVLVSFGHLQMNTAAMSRVATSLLRRFFPLARDPQTGRSRVMQLAGERLYLDLTPALQRLPLRAIVPRLVVNGSQPIADRLRAVLQRPELKALPSHEAAGHRQVARIVGPVVLRALRNLVGDPQQRRQVFERLLAEILDRQARRLAAASSLSARIVALHDDLGEQGEWLLLRAGLPNVIPGLWAEKLITPWARRLLPGCDPGVLLQGLAGNITTEMDLCLAAVADQARGVPRLVAALRSGDAVAVLPTLRSDPDCAAFFAAWDQFLLRFGSRCAGELDPQVPRWREDPRVPLRSIAGALDRPAGSLQDQHAALARRAEGLRDQLAAAAGKRLLGRLQAALVRGLVDRARAFLALREHHKFAMTETFSRTRGLVLQAAVLLHARGAIDHVEDIWLLELLEIAQAVRTVEAGDRPELRPLIAARRALREPLGSAVPPPVMTSHGEILSLPADRSVPAGTWVGTAASGGVYEGIVRVVHDPASDELKAGEVLVARYTDPGWTPLFGHAGALVMEVGGQMTHGSLVARELGIPAVVAVESATTQLRTGERIRVDGDRGWITRLDRDEGERA